MNRIMWEAQVREWLLDDLGRAGDITTDSIVPAGLGCRAHLVARETGVIAGLSVGAAAFGLLDPAVTVQLHADEGASVAAGTTVATVSGPARAVLSAERTCLNIVCHLSGIATATRAVVDLVAGTGAAVVDTRKTTPGLRALEKWAVTLGGGSNHRFGLDDAVLIKDNHIAVAGGITAAVTAARARAGHLVKIEVEVDTLDQLDEALGLPVDVVMLDNFEADRLRVGVQRVRDHEQRTGRRVLIEASGGIRPDTAAAIAASGVDLLSIGRLTNSSPNLDLALDIVTD
ncbi:MAG: carboxylating nicotinate-nucleotide diphosphorylase [Ilumatobacteraceae bacterium]